MQLEKLNKRDTAMDIIRVVAVFFVVSVHFFLNNEYYTENHNGMNMYIMCTMRTLFATCIPMFLLLTGYLMSKKTLCKKYYAGIVRILLIYLMSGIACVIFKRSYLNLDVDLKTAVFELLEFTIAPYAWYIEMYIGLFLIIPFLNILYNGITSQKHKKVLLITLFSMTILPTLFNIFSFTTDNLWYNPSETDVITKILPNWWSMLYPIAYYFIGTYIREYGLKTKTPVAVFLLILALGGFGAFNFFRSYNTVFENGEYISWYGIQPFVMSVFIFTLLSRIKADRIPIWIRWVLWKVSDATLGLYLLSYIFDTIAYKKLLEAVPVMPERLKYYFAVVPFVFICSLALSLVFNILLKLMGFALEQVKSIFVTLKVDTTQKNAGK